MSDKGGFNFGTPFVMAVPNNEPAGLKKHPVDPFAQAMELTDRLKRINELHLFKYGDLCREKAGVGIYTAQPVMAFVRYLDTNDWLDQQILAEYVREHAVNKIDCVIAILAGDSTFICFFVHWSALLEPYTPADPERPASEELQP